MNELPGFTQFELISQNLIVIHKDTRATALSKWHRQFWLAGSAALCSAVLSWMPVSTAQIAGDGTTRTQVNNNELAPCSSGTCQITGGIRANNALFHSFSQFSIPTGSEAVFNASGIRAIFARVTGGKASTINGRISSLAGNADLFFLNPNGIIFGPNASLSIGGSFVATTADSIVFDNGAQFSSSKGSVPSPLLTISVPVGLQFGTSPTPIVVQGNGNNLFLNPNNFEIVRDARPVGLEVSSGATLALMAGEIRLEGGNLTASQGRIELGSVASGSLVAINPTNPGWRFDYSGVPQFRDIFLSQAASVDASGNGGGAIVAQGRQIRLTDGSVLLTKTLGNLAGGDLTVRADSLELVGISPITPLYTGIFADSASTATNRGGSILLQTDKLLVTRGSQISSNTFGAGNAGTLTVRAKAVNVSGGSLLGPSALFAGVGSNASGAGGSLIIDTQQLRITNGGQIATTSFGFGTTGTLTTRADEIELAGVFANPSLGEQPSGLSVDMSENAIGQGGNLTIEAKSLRILGGAQISSITAGRGDAGSIAVRAKDIDINGSSASLASSIVAPASPTATGRGGAVNVQTERLNVTSGAQIFTATLGPADAGNLFINASDFVRLAGQTPNGRSGLFAGSVLSSGSGGDLTVVTDRLFVQEGATISVSNFPSTTNSPFPPGQGSAGNLNIRARTLSLGNQALLTADTVVGDRGNIDVQTNVLTMQKGSRISTDATGTASGGNIRITAPRGFILARANENSDITANATQGNGGRVDITARSIYGIRPRDRLTAFSDITASSEFGVAGSVTLDTPYFEAAPGLLQATETPKAPVILQACQPGQGGATASRFINSGRGGSRTQPTDPLTSQTILGDATLPEQWNESRGARSSRPSISPPERIVEAQGWTVNDRGKVVLSAEVPNATTCRWQARSKRSVQ
jgi:filamentous hemagglutinin family protein